MIDFTASYFSKFIAPECIQQNGMLQVQFDKEKLLNGLNTQEDTELDISVHIKGQNNGLIKILKTREWFLVPATCPFSIDEVVTSEEDYVFPNDQLLLSTDPKNFKTIKSLYKQNDVMTLKFSPNFLTFESEDKSEFELKS